MQERLGCPSRTAHCCPLATEEVDESGEVLLLPLLSEPVSSGRKKQRIYHPALLRGKERCSHHLLKSSPNHLRVARPRASCSWLWRPSWQGLGRAGDTAYDWLHGAAWVEAVAAGSGGSRRGSPSATSRLRCCRRQSACNSGPPGQDVANRLRLLLYSRELLGEVLDRVAKEAGLGHGGIKEPDFVGIPHVGQTQPEMAFLDHQSGHRTAHCPRRNLRRLKREVRHSMKFVMNLWVMTTLVQVSQCLGLMDLQQRHSV